MNLHVNTSKINSAFKEVFTGKRELLSANSINTPASAFLKNHANIKSTFYKQAQNAKDECVTPGAVPSMPHHHRSQLDKMSPNQLEASPSPL
jgi:hypothetical protein